MEEGPAPQSLETATRPLKIIYVAFFKPHALLFYLWFKNTAWQWDTMISDLRATNHNAIWVASLLTSFLNTGDGKGSFGLSLFVKSWHDADPHSSNGPLANMAVAIRQWNSHSRWSLWSQRATWVRGCSACSLEAVLQVGLPPPLPAIPANSPALLAAS